MTGKQEDPKNSRLWDPDSIQDPDLCIRPPTGHRRTSQRSATPSRFRGPQLRKIQNPHARRDSALYIERPGDLFVGDAGGTRLICRRCLGC